MKQIIIICFICIFPLFDDINHVFVEVDEEGAVYSNACLLEKNWASFKETPSIEHFNNFRISFKRIQFLLPLMLEIDSLPRINNNKFWVLRDSIFAEQFNETGSLQFLEKALEKEEVKDESYTFHMNQLDSFVLETKTELKARHFEKKELLLAILMDQYQQYFLYLSGYERLDTNFVIDEYSASILAHKEILQQVSEQLESKQDWLFIVDRLEQLVGQLENTTFSQLDRVKLLKQGLLPVWKRLNSLVLVHWPQGVPEWANRLSGLTAMPFSDDWLNSSTFFNVSDGVNKDSLLKLGEWLFYDPLLSLNGKRTCASCHKPQKAFSDGRATSMGFDFSAKLDRNAPSLVNTVFNQAFSHDGRHKDIVEQTRSVIYNHQEFRANLELIVDRLKTSATYQNSFQTTFGTSQLDSNQVLEAIAAYTASIVSFNSPFDQFMRGDSNKINPQVIEGYNLFMGKGQCGSCHFAPLFSGLKPPFYKEQEFHSHGANKSSLWENAEDEDIGIGKLKGDSYDYYFKTPSLRNLSYSAPYMHNGLYNDLDEVLTFIFNKNSKVHQGANIQPTDIDLTRAEQQSIKAFLESLKDEQIDIDYSERIDLPLTDGSLVPEKRRPSGVY